jgi:hypothetical protein
MPIELLLNKIQPVVSDADNIDHRLDLLLIKVSFYKIKCGTNRLKFPVIKVFDSLMPIPAGC